MLFLKSCDFLPSFLEIPGGNREFTESGTEETLFCTMVTKLDHSSGTLSYDSFFGDTDA